MSPWALFLANIRLRYQEWATRRLYDDPQFLDISRELLLKGDK